mgnify:FL=1
MKSPSAYTIPIFSDERKLDMKNSCDAWDSNVDAVIRSDVRIGYEAVIGDGNKEKNRRTIPVIQSGNMAALECAE